MYDLLGDDKRMRGLTTLAGDAVGPAFDRLRKEYPVRREFYNTRVSVRGAQAKVAEALKGLGFKVAVVG